MANKHDSQHGINRNRLSYIVLIFSTSAITILAAVTIFHNPDEAKDIFNIILPVFSSWVGTILAFYFGRENFEAANKQVRELVEKLGPEERSDARVTSIMRPLKRINVFQISEDLSEARITVSQLRQKITSEHSRLPIVDHENKPLYMIHGSTIDRYLTVGNHTREDTLEQFLNWQKQEGSFFNVNKGFVIVSEKTTIASAKQKMESIPSCQDIFITPEGSRDEPLSGWISNMRLAKFMNT
ncbi:MAG: hypothetical protein QNJ46_22690 [Leptolyngbyaceae cyanobacterium MO_188.B28]|nr:hypothetical protein [Leptolyngbyaceae cyanobacterium MO_188.B28]